MSPEMAHSAQNFKAPSIQLSWFLYTPSIHEIVKKIPLPASHTRSVQHMNAPSGGGGV